MSKERTFRPAWPRLGEFRGAALFAMIITALLYATVRDSDTKWLPAAGGSALLMTAGLWLALHHRVPGRPKLFIDNHGLHYSRFGREQVMRWDEVERIEVDHDRNLMKFVPISGRTPITTHSQMVTAGGESFVGLIEVYWTSKKRRGR